MGKVSDSVEAGNLGSYWELKYFVDDFNQPTVEVNFMVYKYDLLIHSINL
jgi:hypothetical protein